MSQIRDCENFFHLETALQTFRTTITNLHNGIPDTRRALSGTASWPTSSGSTSFLSFSPGYGDFPAVKNPSLFTSHIQRLEKSTRETNEHTHAPAHTHTNRSGHCGETTNPASTTRNKYGPADGRSRRNPFPIVFFTGQARKNGTEHTTSGDTCDFFGKTTILPASAGAILRSVVFGGRGHAPGEPRAKIGPWPPIGGKSGGNFFRLFRNRA